jgi:hypothetical protein
MILAVGLSIFLINKEIGWSMSDFIISEELKSYSNIFVFDNFLERNHFVKSFIG